MINDFFKKLNYPTDYNIRVVVVKDNVVNAYALPGGRIVVYEGILRKMDDYRELTALLSHEFSHVQLKHSTRNIARSLSSALLLSVLFGDASGITAIIIENADAIKQLGYSRQLEEDADRNGLALMKKRKIDPHGMKELFETLQKESEGEEDGYKFLSTHPLTKDRITFVNKEISKKDFIWQPDAELDSLYKEIQNNLEE
ncbi:MAG: M48 family metallopeptidase [Bacteroidetes bacterium]|nr:M48 family metallopeptidase [Bacteroidota bacterium]